MNIELRNIQIQNRQSEETIAFTASLYIDGKKVGYAKNSGNGGCTDYGPDNYHDNQSKEAINNAELYCAGLAPNKFEYEGQHFENPSSLEVVIDRIIDEFWQEKEAKRFKNKIAKDQLTAILIGNEHGYKKIYWPVKGQRKILTIAELLSTTHGTQLIKNAINKEVVEPGTSVLNTNIPDNL